MTTDPRAALQRAVEALAAIDAAAFSEATDFDSMSKMSDLAEKALAETRAALAQFELAIPTDEELEDLADAMNTGGYPVPAMRRALELWGLARPQWQPIDTAPKDGTDVLVLLDCATVPVVHIAWWRSREEWESSGQYCGGWDSVEYWEGWWSYTRNSMTQEKLDGYQSPTHWMPMPTPPTSEEILCD